MSNLIGTNPDQVPVNGMLGDLAFQDSDSVKVTDLTVTNRLNLTNASDYNLYASGAGANYLGGSTVINVADNTNAALRITQLGTGNALVVEDSANPDSTPFVIDSEGKIISGALTAFAASTLTPGLNLLGIGGSNPYKQNIGMAAFGANNNGPSIYFGKSRGAAIGDAGLVSDGDFFGALFFEGSDGTGQKRGATIAAQVDGTPGTNDMPGRLVFSTTADGASSPTERMRIDSAGRVGIGNTPSGTYKLEVSGAISGTQLTSTIAIGTAPFVVTSTTPVTNLSIGGNAGTATSLSGGVAGSVPYQTAASTTAMTAASTVAGQVLTTVTAGGAPTWVTPSSGSAFTNLSYTGTLTGGTGVLAIGTNQIYKDANGNVGIGTSSPAADTAVTIFNAGTALSGTGLMVRSGYPGYSGTVANILSLRDKDNTTDTFNIKTDGSLSLNHFSASGTYTNSLTVNASGNVGIGTTSPSGKLGIVTTASTAAWQIVANTTGVSNQTGIYADASNNMQFAARDGSGVLRVVIDSNSSTNSYINSGNVGIGTASPSYKLQVAGSFAATTKSFVIDHPTKEGMKLRYGSLEGPENGIYIRGRLKDSNIIELPEYWTKLIDEDSITVNLTPIGKHQKLYVADIVDNTVIIGNDNILQKEINCFYTVFAERIDVEKLIVEVE